MSRKDEEIMNRATLIGNLSKDPELRITASSGVSVCTFTIAVNRGFGDKKEVDFIPIVTWRGLADNCAKFLTKGSKVGVSGRIQTRSYDANDGSKRYVTEIVADDVEFLSPKEQSKSPDQQNFNEPDDFEPLDDEQMPF
jgi:single-strand DNA-binding protein